MKVTKRKQTWANLDAKKVYALDEAIETLRGFCSKKFDESLEIAIKFTARFMRTCFQFQCFLNIV